jgi:hypothetical protein
MLRSLLQTYVSPFARDLFPDTGGAELDAHHGFVVEYDMKGDRKLDLHVDDSEVTLNLSLGEQFEGGGLEFAGARCSYHQGTEPQPAEVFRLEHRTGQAYLHRGRHRHMATPITAGHRLNLILWCLSLNYREQEEEMVPTHPPPAQGKGRLTFLWFVCGLRVQATCRQWCGYYELARQNKSVPAPPSTPLQPTLLGHGPAPSHACGSADCKHDHAKDAHAPAPASGSAAPPAGALDIPAFPTPSPAPAPTQSPAK